MSGNLQLALPRAHGPAVLKAAIRSTPEDFLVEEIDAFEASGSGEHLLLTIEKRSMNTAFVAGRIAHWANIPVSGIGYAGLKDRHAVTRQRFSVHLPGRAMPDIAALEADAPGTGLAQRLRVFTSSWHAKKLPRGALSGNRFVLVLRDLEGDHDLIDARLQAILETGVPNYFGGQRFGHADGNVSAALAMFAGRRVRRDQRTYLLSAARSQLFNRVLASRVEAGNWDRPLDGEVWMLDGSRSVFGPESWSETLAQRLTQFDIHPTAPLWGRGMPRATESAALLEKAVLADGESLALRAGLEAAGLTQARRATRLRPQDLAWNWIDTTTLRLHFSLPPGTYATTILAELGEIIDRAARH